VTRKILSNRYLVVFDLVFGGLGQTSLAWLGRIFWRPVLENKKRDIITHSKWLHTHKLIHMSTRIWNLDFSNLFRQLFLYLMAVVGSTVNKLSLSPADLPQSCHQDVGVSILQVVVLIPEVPHWYAGTRISRLRLLVVSCSATVVHIFS